MAYFNYDVEIRGGSQCYPNIQIKNFKMRISKLRFTESALCCGIRLHKSATNKITSGVVEKLNNYIFLKSFVKSFGL